MNTEIFEHIRENLLRQRRNLSDWLANTPTAKKEIRLGPAGEEAVQTHLQVLDTAIHKTEDQSLGRCEVCHDYIEPDRLEMDYTCCVCLDHLSTEERGQLEYELELASKVQQALLPQHVPEIPELELAAFSRPAQIVGGDYFDFFRFQDGAHGLVIGDVVGHGMSASLLMAGVQASLRTLAPDHVSPAAIVRRLNLLFYHNIRLTKFVTLFVARFDTRTSSLTYCNAGHNPPLVTRVQFNGKEDVAWLRPTGAAIGLVEEFQFEEATVALATGDVLLLYTDGVTEAVNSQEEEFGSQRLADLVQQNASRSAHDLVQAVRQRLREFNGGDALADDITLVAAKLLDLGTAFS